MFVSFLQGTTASQDTRFSDKEKKLLKQMKFGDSLTQKVIDIFYFFKIIFLIYFINVPLISIYICENV